MYLVHVTEQYLQRYYYLLCVYEMMLNWIVTATKQVSGEYWMYSLLHYAAYKRQWRIPAQGELIVPVDNILDKQ